MYIQVLNFVYSLYFDITVAGYKVLDALSASVQAVVHGKLTLL